MAYDWKLTAQKVLIALAIFGIPQLLAWLKGQTGEWALLFSTILAAVYDFYKHRE